MANKFYDGRVILVGDSAHSFPPAGGLGMNSGIMDAHNLAFRMAEGLTKESLEEYSMERSESVRRNLEVANSLFQRSMDIAKTLGLDIKKLNLLESLMSPLKSMPFSQTIFSYGVKAGSYHLESDVISKGMASSLQKKNIHIPLILLENEFQAKLDLPKVKVSQKSETAPKIRSLLLMPHTELTLFKKARGSVSKTVSPARDLGIGIDASVAKLPLEVSGHEPAVAAIESSLEKVVLAEQQSSNLDQYLNGAEAADGYYLAKDDLLKAMPSLDQYLRSPHKLFVRKDGYLEVQQL